MRRGPWTSGTYTTPHLPPTPEHHQTLFHKITILLASYALCALFSHPPPSPTPTAPKLSLWGISAATIPNGKGSDTPTNASASGISFSSFSPLFFLSLLVFHYQNRFLRLWKIGTNYICARQELEISTRNLVFRDHLLYYWYSSSLVAIIESTVIIEMAISKFVLRNPSHYPSAVLQVGPSMIHDSLH